VRTKILSVVGCVFLIFQFIQVIHAQFGPRRYFCWAPNDYSLDYTLQVSVNGSQLSPEQIIGRYHLPATMHGWDGGPGIHIVDWVREYEQTLGRNDQAQIDFKWKLNGAGPEQEWRWPEEDTWHPLRHH
jgi:hypothetical protein